MYAITSQWWRRLVNAYGVEAGMVFQVKLWSIPERLESEVLTMKGLYKSAYLYLFTFNRRRGRRNDNLPPGLWLSAFIVVPHTQGAQVRITQFYLQITPYLPLPRKRSPDGASPDWGCRHLIAAYYSFIYPERMKG